MIQLPRVGVEALRILKRSLARLDYCCCGCVCGRGAFRKCMSTQLMPRVQLSLTLIDMVPNHLGVRDSWRPRHPLAELQKNPSKPAPPTAPPTIAPKLTSLGSQAQDPTQSLHVAHGQLHQENELDKQSGTNTSQPPYRKNH